MPNRILKESICVSDTIDTLSWFEEVLFYRLIVNCDDYGRFDGRVNIIKNRLFPLKDGLTAKAVKDGINRLSTVGLVTLYEFEGRPYLQLVTWNDHQSIRARKSKYPAISDSVNADASRCMQMHADEIKCKQMQAEACKCSRNPIQSESESESKSESESESEAGKPPAHSRSKKAEYGQFHWVKLSEDEYAALERDLGGDELRRCIAYVDESAQATGNKNRWKDWNLVLRKCHRDGWGLQKDYGKPKPSYGCGELGQAELEAIQRAMRG